MKGNALWIAGGAALGVIPAVIHWKTDVTAQWEALSTPFRLVGEGLRAMSLSGAVGNILSWVIVLAVCVLPALLLLQLWRTEGETHWEDGLLFLAVPQLFAFLYYLVNPTRFGSADLAGELARTMFPIAVCQTLLSTLIAWGVLRLLRRLNGASGERLAGWFQPMLQVCAVLLTAASVYGRLSELLMTSVSVMEGNTGASSGSVRFTILMLVLLALMELIPDLLAAMTLLWGADLAGLMGRSAFDQEAVERCEGTAVRCRRVAQTTVLLALFANLLQLILMDRLYDSRFTVNLPLFSLALSVGLFLLCRCLQRGKELQEDNNSII